MISNLFSFMTPSKHNFLMRTSTLKDFSCYVCVFLSILNILYSSENKATILFTGFTSYCFQMYTQIKDKLKDFRLKMQHARHIIKDFTQTYVSHSEKSANN